MEELGNINILRAVAHESKLETVPDGHLTLSHELIGHVDRNALVRLLEEDGVDHKEIENGLTFFDILMRKTADIALAGYSVDTSWFRASITLSGIVPVERLGHNAHPGEVEIRLNLTPDKRIREEIVNTPVAIRKNIASNAPIIQSVMDALSETSDTITVGEMVEIRGLNIGVYGDKTAEIGVFFTSEDETKTVHIPAGKCKPNTASLVQFVAPPTLTPGQWTVKLATQITGKKGVYTQEVREDIYTKPITVEAPPAQA
jgi:hypothetical protein